MGLHLVTQLSSSVGWEKRPGRKHVWARLPTGRTEAQEQAQQRDRLPEPRSGDFRRE
jgi:hypothetical protein